MFKYIIKLSLRNILKNKFSTLINVFGLLLGITCCLILFTKIRYERGFDQFHSDNERIYRIVRVTSGLDYLQGGLEYRGGIQWAFPGAIRREVPELEQVVQILYLRAALVGIPSENKESKLQLFKEEKGFAMVEPEFFEMFDFKEKSVNWISGNPENALKEPFSVVLTEKLAAKYFKDTNPIGKTISLRGERKYRITGVISDLPDNTNFPFTILASLSSIEAQYAGIFSNWGGLPDFHQCFIKLRPGVSVADVETKLKQIHGRNTDNFMNEERLFKLQPLEEIHSDERFVGHNFNPSIFSDTAYYILLLIIFFLVLIVAINYSNLSIAMSAKRIREIAVRKVVGVKRGQLVLHFFSESLLLTGLAIVLGYLLSALMVRQWSGFFGLPEESSISFDVYSIVFTLAICLVISFISGGYPSFKFSRLNVVSSLKDLSVPSLFKGFNFSKSSVFAQFFITQIMIIGALLIYKQLHFINNKDLGYDKIGILTVDIPDRDVVKMERFRNQLKSIPSITDVSFASSSPAVSSSFSDIRYTNNGTPIDVLSVLKFVDSCYIKTFGLELLAGENFNRQDSIGSIIINQQFLSEAGIKDMYSAVGQIVGTNRNNRVRIIGVVKDFHANSIHEHIRPSVLVYNQSNFYSVGIRFDAPEVSRGESKTYYADLINRVQNEWDGIYQGSSRIFEYSFLDDDVASYYEDESRFAGMVYFFTSILILISCLGIIGLSFYNIRGKIKEIAIRKVNGAHAFKILVLFCSEYFRLVIMAMIIAAPVSYYVISLWLESFAYKSEISWWIFVFSGLLSLAIVMLTISWQSWKAANQNPVDALNYE